MRIFPIYSSGMASNTYLVTDDMIEHAVIIDPSFDMATVFRQCGRSPKIEAILLTHAHFDHMLCLHEWRTATGAELSVGRGDKAAVTDPARNLFSLFSPTAPAFSPAERLLSEGDSIAFGNESLRVLEVPGHTAGCVAFLAKDAIFTGDTIFEGGSYGRTDFPSGDLPALIRSVNKLFSLDGDYTVYAGHGPISTLKQEALLNPLKEN